MTLGDKVGHVKEELRDAKHHVKEEIHHVAEEIVHAKEHVREEIVQAREHVREEVAHVKEAIHHAEERVIEAALQTDNVTIKVEIGPRLKIGIALFVLSFLMGYPLAFLAGVLMGPVWIAYFYGASWVVFIAALGIGGRPARDAVAHWQIKIKHTVRKTLAREK